MGFYFLFRFPNRLKICFSHVVARQATVTRRIPIENDGDSGPVSPAVAIHWEDEDDDDAEEAWDPEFQM